MVIVLENIGSKDNRLPIKGVNDELILSFLINNNSPQWLIILSIISIRRVMQITCKKLLDVFVNTTEKEYREELDDDHIGVDFDDIIEENNMSEINNSQFKSKIKAKNRW